MESEIIVALADVTRLVRRRFDSRARAIGVSRPQWQALTLINRNDGINQGGLADLLDVEPITVGRMVDRLQEAGLVDRRADPADRRAWRLHLTAKGEAIIEQLRPLAKRLSGEALAGLDAGVRQQLMDSISLIRANLQQLPEGCDHADG